VSTLIIVRHGRSSSNSAGTLAGRMPGIHLDETGEAQARTLGERLTGIDLAAVVCSPLERCQQTARLALQAAGTTTDVTLDDRVVETDYGAWSGRLLADLATEPLWATVQSDPGSARFPDGEAMPEVVERVVDAVRDWNSRLPAEAVWMVVSHGDVINGLLGWCLGQPFEHVQRLMVDPASAAVVHLPPPDKPDAPPRVACLNTVAGPLSAYTTPPAPAQASVGGGVGATGAAPDSAASQSADPDAGAGRSGAGTGP